MDNKQGRVAAHFYLFLTFIIITPILTCGCSHLHGGFSSGSGFKEANDLFSRGSYAASLKKYEQIMEKYPAAGDRVLFEMGIIYAYPSNEQKDYGKSLECFQKIMKDYPESRYRQDSAKMITHIGNVTIRDKRIAALHTQIATLEIEAKNKEDELTTRQRKIEALEQEVRSKEDEIIARQAQIAILQREVEEMALELHKGQVSRILIEKGERRLTLISKGKALKSYKIALGRNPNGPKERKGDNKTPEGIYTIDSRNRDSRYHLSLRISYPNEKDKKRARKLGVSPGGDIMIHGLKNGFSLVGDLHSEIDWTRGCIAVTNEEIEEIARLVPNGTVVEIKP